MNLIFPNSVYHNKDLIPLSQSLLTHQKGWTFEIGKTLSDWYNDSRTIEIMTSGSTGEPKHIALLKSAMEKSAHLTSQALNLPRGTNAFSALPANYIGGKMMIIRALVLNWNLYLEPPSSNPIGDLEDDIDFIAMTPHQLSTVLKQTPGQLAYVDKILLGGGPVSSKLEAQISELKNDVYLGFGMTETITHIALKKLNGADKTDIFSAIEGVRFSLTEDSCLVIAADHIEKKVITNDIVNLVDASSFIWLGRKDNVIISGGIKIYPEELEKALADKISYPFYFYSEGDDTLGQKLILVIEHSESILPDIKDSLLVLNKYQQPKAIYFTNKFEYTQTGKIKRSETFNSLKHQ